MVWLWSVGSIERVGDRGQEILANGNEEIYFSCASSWELAIKTRIGKYTLPEPPPRYVPKMLAEQGIRPLPITQTHALKVYDLPLYHRDPFDRLIIAQALTEEMIVLTSDRDFEKYSIPVVWCGR